MRSRDVIGHVTIQLAVVNFLWVVQCDHASIWRRYRDMAPQSTGSHTQNDEQNDQSLNLLQFSLCSPWRR